MAPQIEKQYPVTIKKSARGAAGEVFFFCNRSTGWREGGGREGGSRDAKRGDPHGWKSRKLSCCAAPSIECLANC